MALVRSSAQAAVVQATDSHLRAQLAEPLVELLQVADLLEVHDEGGLDLVRRLVEAFQVALAPAAASAARIWLAPRFAAAGLVTVR